MLFEIGYGGILNFLRKGLFSGQSKMAAKSIYRKILTIHISIYVKEQKYKNHKFQDNMQNFIRIRKKPTELWNFKIRSNYVPLSFIQNQR